MSAKREYHLNLFAATGFLIRTDVHENVVENTVIAGKLFDAEPAIEVIEMKEVITVGKKVLVANRSFYLRNDHEHHKRLMKKAQVERVLEKERGRAK